MPERITRDLKNAGKRYSGRLSDRSCETPVTSEGMRTRRLWLVGRDADITERIDARLSVARFPLRRFRPVYESLTIHPEQRSDTPRLRRYTAR